MTIQRTIAGSQWQTSMANSAGPKCKTIEQVAEMAESSSGAIVVGSITEQFREGNRGDVYWFDPHGEFSLNSLGLPNPGALYYQEHLPKMVEIAHAASKPLWVSVAGFTPLEYGKLAFLASQVGADVVELNLGCPNVWEGGKQERIFSFDPSLVQEVLFEVGAYTDIPVAVKVSPFSDPVLLQEVASVIIESSPLVKAVVAINTFPNAFAVDRAGTSVISPQFSKGLAGMAGPALKAITLGQIMQWRDLLPEDIDMVGVGGIWSGQDVLDCIKAGAQGVQLGTVLEEEGLGVFGTILKELVPTS